MTHASTRARAIIVGGSLGGLFAANLLVRNGWRVDVFERVPEELAGRGAGIVTHPELFEALAAAGIDFDDSIGVKVQSRVTFAQNGAVLSARDLPQTLTAWGKMYHVLRAALPDVHYHAGGTVAAVQDGPEKALVTLTDGTVLHADLVIAAVMSHGAVSSTKQRCRAKPARRYSRSLPSACRRASRFSAIRSRARAIARPRASVATTSSGIARRAKTFSCRTC
jgi:2-polyprenyl-6-methoxyphenol hydroxylase-like FAD-dependent oxidoreductase